MNLLKSEKFRSQTEQDRNNNSVADPLRIKAAYRNNLIHVRVHQQPARCNQRVELQTHYVAVNETHNWTFFTSDLAYRGIRGTDRRRVEIAIRPFAVSKLQCSQFA